MKLQRTICIGDVHGCLDEGRELLKKVEYRPGRDQLVFLGDLIDRGPYPVYTVKWVRGIQGAICIRGNHEQKALDFLRKEAIARAGGPPNEMMRPDDERIREWESLSEQDLKWMASLPIHLDIGDNWIAVHAGFEPVPLREQKDDRVIRVRWIDEKTGEMVGLNRGSREQPKGTVDWQFRWKGPMNVVYGHAIQKKKPRIDKNGPVTMIGVDTGCCYGGALTAVVLIDGKFREYVQVQADRPYRPWPKGQAE